MRAINIVFATVIGGLLRPFESWPPLAGLTAVSLVSGVALLLAFKVTSNQRALAAARRQVDAGLFELRLFQDDPYTIARVIGSLARRQAIYLRYALVPLLWIAVPLALLASHLETRYGYEPLRPGQSALVVVRVQAPAGEDRPSIALDAADDGVRIETPGVWSARAREMAWRIGAARDGDHELRVRYQDETLSARVGVSATGAAVPVAIVRPAASLWEQARYPAEPPLPAGSRVESIAIAYPPRAFDIFGISFHWLVIFLIVSTACALACRRIFGVVL